MVERMLIVRGVRTTDDLQALGLPMAHNYDASNIVALVGTDGRGLIVKGSKATTVVRYVDVDPAVGRLSHVLRDIKEAYEQINPGRAHLSHIIVGMFLFYWVDIDTRKAIIELVSEGDLDAIERARDRFLLAEFGDNLAGVDTLEANGERDAAGHSTADRAQG